MPTTMDMEDAFPIDYVSFQRLYIFGLYGAIQMLLLLLLLR